MKRDSAALIGVLLCVLALAVTTVVAVGRERVRLGKWDQAHAEVDRDMRALLVALLQSGIARRNASEPDDEYANRTQSLQTLCKTLDVPWAVGSEATKTMSQFRADPIN